MARIPEHFIHEVLSRLDIVPLIQSYIPLKKMGTNFGACCPFHHEKSPSFTVSPAKQFYHCFGCGEHGDAISFISKMENLTFPEALEKLANQVGLSMPAETQDKSDIEYAPLYQVLDQAKQFYCQQLRQHPAAKSAIAYLKSRGLTGEIAKAFSIGFAPPGWSNLYDRLTQQGVALERAGLVLPGKKGHPYDRFRHRIMFPIFDLKGRTVGFGARAMGDEQPKYLNSPETLLFHKGKQFYGLYEALKVRKWSQLIVVEGYLDVIALAQFGIMGAVATLGTALTETHIQLLFKYTQIITFCFDGDTAGQKAAEKALATILPQMHAGREVKFVFLPPKHDPDSFIRKEGRDAFQVLLDNADTLADFFFRSTLKNISQATLTQKAAMIESAEAMVQRLPKSMYRTLIEARLKEFIPTAPAIPQKNNVPPALISPAIKAALMLMRYPGLVKEIPSVPELLEQHVEGMVMLRFVLTHLQKGHLDSEDLTSVCKENGIVISKYDAYLQAISAFTLEEITAEFKGAILRINEIGRRVMTEKLLEKAKKGELSEDEKQTLKDLLI